MKYKYALVDPSTVDFETKRAAYMALAAASKELELPMVRIEWFEHIEFVKNPTETFEDDKDLRGLYLGKTPDTIYVRAGQFPEKIQETVLHETFHLWQSLAGHGGNEGNEDRANGYAADAMRRMAAGSEDETAYFDHLMGKDWSTDHLRKEMDRRLGRKPKAAPTKAPKPQPDPRQGGYDKWTNRPSADGSIRKQTYGRTGR